MSKPKYILKHSHNNDPAQFNSIYPKRPLDEHYGSRILFRPEFKSCYTQWENLKKVLNLALFLTLINAAIFY